MKALTLPAKCAKTCSRILESAPNVEMSFVINALRVGNQMPNPFKQFALLDAKALR